jgi:hypothetical protein
MILGGGVVVYGGAMVTLELTPKTSEMAAALATHAAKYGLYPSGESWLVDRDTDDENAATVWGNVLAESLGFPVDALNVKPT